MFSVRSVPFILAWMFCGATMASGQVIFFTDLSDESGAPGDDVTVSATMNSSQGSSVVAFQWGVCHDPAVVDATGVAQGATTMIANCGLPPDVFVTNTNLATGHTVVCTISVQNICFIPPGPSYELAVTTYNLVGSGGDSTSLDYCILNGVQPLIQNAFGETAAPLIDAGSITIDNPEQFIRGDADGSGSFNPLSDSIFLLSAGFVPGSDQPPCTEAADTDGDGVFNALVDALYSLAFGFTMGGAPPAPFPDCGADPDPGTSLGCATLPPCP